MIRHYPDGTIALHAYVRFNPLEKTLTLERGFDGEPVGNGWKLPMTVALDSPGGDIIQLCLQRWLAQTEPTPEEMKRYGRDAEGKQVKS